jgi:hypothetical protein
VPGRWPPRGLLVSAAATDAGLDPASVDHPTSASRADPSPDTSPSPREEAETEDASGSHRVGGFGPWPHSNVRSFLRLSFASCTVHTSQKYHRTHHLDEHLTVGVTRSIDRQTRDHRLAFCGTQRHIVCWLLHNRFLDWLSVTAADGAGQPWPTAACAWLCAQATAAEVKTTQARQPQPGGHRSPPW